MPDVKEILRKLIDREPGMNPTKLSRETGVPQSTVWRILNGESLDPDTATVAPLAARFGKSVAQLRGEIPLEIDNATSENVKEVVTLPLISWVAAGRGEANDPYAPGAAESWEPFDGPFTKSAFCLRVRGDSMVKPDGTGFPEGCIIAVDPGLKAKGGDFVVVRFNDTNEATFKELVIDGPFKYLKPLNPAYQMFPVSPDAQLCGVVTEVNLKRRFR